VAVFDARAEITAVQISEPMEDYIAALVAATRQSNPSAGQHTAFAP